MMKKAKSEIKIYFPNGKKLDAKTAIPIRNIANPVMRFIKGILSSSMHSECFILQSALGMQFPKIMNTREQKISTIFTMSNLQSSA